MPTSNTLRGIFAGIAASLLLAAAARACFWIEGTTLEGGVRSVSKRNPATRLLEAMGETPENKLNKLIRGTPTIVSNYGTKEEGDAISAILSGNLADGIGILEEIEKTSPGIYSTAANLGTAYELKGDNRKAFEWITEGIKRNPGSHHGTEWLHQKILEAKIEVEADPAWLKSHHIIDFTDADLANLSIRHHSGDHEFTLEEIKTALDFQLHERVIFVKPQDPVVADLLYTYAKIEAKMGILEYARDLLDLSLIYGYQSAAALNETRVEFETVIERRRFNKHLNVGIGCAKVLGMSALFGGILYFALLKEKASPFGMLLIFAIAATVILIYMTVNVFNAW